MVSSSRQRAVRIGLRERRSAAGKTMQDVVAQLGWSINKLHRIETGQTVPTPVEVTRILLALGAPETEVEYLTTLAEQAQQQPNWPVSVRGMPRHFGPLTDFEREATELTEVSVTNVPGLLQLPDYARALSAAAGVPAADIERRVSYRMQRQEVLVRTGTPVQFRALIHEAVLHYRYGGPQVTVTQLRYLAAVSRYAHVSVRVIPFEADYSPADGAYRILAFANLPPLVHVEHPAGAEFIEQPWLVENFIAFTAQLAGVALSPEDSLRLIEKEIEKVGIE